MTQNRTHTCGELRLSDAGKAVKICGWLENLREVGSELAFAVVRDFYGTTQVVAETAHTCWLFARKRPESAALCAALDGQEAARLLNGARLDPEGFAGICRLLAGDRAEELMDWLL